MLKILTVIGARPQFIKASAVSRVIEEEYRGNVQEVLLHTGQHYDLNMSQVFFDDLRIPKPAYNLEVFGGGHGAMTGRMLEGIENILQDEKPDWILVYGDTNSTLAGALAGAKLHIPVAHVEAGLRSYNMRMPEEVNRVIADKLSSLLFCPTSDAVTNLKDEGISEGVHMVGDVMYDVALNTKSDVLAQQSHLLKKYAVAEGGFVLATCHRAENTDDLDRLQAICKALGRIAASISVILPLHPRTRNIVIENNFMPLLDGVQIVDPLPFFEMSALVQSAKVIVTDSGGVQKEAFFFGTPCVTMRDETEWKETIDLGWNVLAGADSEVIYTQVFAAKNGEINQFPYGDGHAGRLIVERMLRRD